MDAYEQNHADRARGRMPDLHRANASFAAKLVKYVRDRYDGRRRNPWNEMECGSNYARSMAAWNCLLAWRLTHAKEGE